MSRSGCLAILTSLVIHSEASRILAVFPTPSISHQVVFRPLILELVNRGHELVTVTTDPMFKKNEAPENLTEIDVHDLSYDIWRTNFLKAEVASGDKNDLQMQVKLVYDLMHSVFEAQMLTSEVQVVLSDKNNKFDLLLLEAYYFPLLGLLHLYNVPVIQVSSFGSIVETLLTVGAPTHPILYPTLMNQKVQNMTFWEKTQAIYDVLRVDDMITEQENTGDMILERLFGPDVPPIRELKNNIDMIFLNAYPHWEMNRPIPPNIVYIGGIHKKPEKELPKDLKNYLDSSKNGVVYVSFGTNVEPALLPPGRMEAIIKALSKVPYDVLFKWNQDELPGRSENIKISKWLPQSDLLKHPNVKLFITQGGLQSTDEAIQAGVPLVGIPIIADQWFNVEMYVYHKIGQMVDMETITTEKLETAIRTVVSDESYRKNIQKLRSLVFDQPQTPLERAIWWTEYVLRHKGAKHLRSPAANMPLTEYYEIQLFSYLILGAVSVLTVVILFAYYVYSSIFKKYVISAKLKSS